jgi:aldehyde:ferredoxin oxidoreductase
MLMNLLEVEKITRSTKMPDWIPGKILSVDLSSQTIQSLTIEPIYEWIGGRGLGIHLLSHEPDLYKDDQALQPVVISMGPLVGGPVLMGVRTAVTARNLVSGGICYSNVGGDFGVRARMAGVDSLVITGKSAKPVCLVLENETAKFIPAEDLWGMTINQMRDRILELYDPDHTSFIGIGPAGERGALVSCLMVDRAHAAGWGGSGALFGLKNLKAVIAIGKTPVKFHDPAKLVEKARHLAWRIHASEAAAGLTRGGTHGMAGAGGITGVVPTAVRNMQDEYLPDDLNAPLKEQAFKKWETGRMGCTGCEIRCLHYYEMESEIYGSLASEGMHANSVRGLGSNLGVTKPDDLLALHDLCNNNGMDTDGVASSLAFALECADHGILDRDQAGGIHLEWGDGPSLVKLIRQMVAGEGLGKILGDGPAKAADRVGNGSEKYAMTVKSVGLNEQGIRSHRAWALGIMTSTRGAGHLGGAPQTENRRISPEAGRSLFGVADAGIPSSYNGKGKLAAWTEGIKAVVDTLGLCYFIYGWYEPSLGNPEDMAEWLYLATGMKMTGKQLHWLGLRIHTLERLISYRLAGYSRIDDRVPDRFFETGNSGGAYPGAHLDEVEVNQMLDEYYSTLHWEVETGLPGEAALKYYKLDQIALP